jgi:hypothetical protein
MIWQFGEMGYDISINYNGRLGPKPVRWDYLNDYRRKYLSDFYGALIRLRTENPAFESENFTLYTGAAMKKIIITSPEMNVVVLGNYGVTAGTIQPGFTHFGTWYEYFTGESYEVIDMSVEIPLEPGEYKLFTDVQLPVPQIHTGFSENPVSTGTLKVFPNPGRDLTVEFYLETPGMVSVDVFDICGKHAGNIFTGRMDQGMQSLRWSAGVTSLKPGVYLLRLTTGDATTTRRIVLQ